MNHSTTSSVSAFNTTAAGLPAVPIVAPSVEVESRSQPSQQRAAVRPQPLAKSDYLTIKPWIDRLLTIVLSVIALPLIGLTALLVRLIDGRPIFYRQIRMGRDGRPFRIWKFRTMRPDAERETGAVWSHHRDPRVTKLGRWLRCTHLDELPQFFNIYAGHMNLVGPRPERPEFVRELERDIPQYHDRLAVRPGITGQAQLRLGYDRSIAEVADKVAIDRQYIQNATLIGDLSLLLQTLPYLIKQVSTKLRNRESNRKDSLTPPNASASRKVA